MEFEVWTSTDLTNWTRDEASTQEIVATSGETETVDVTLSPPLRSENRLFVRVSNGSL
jgi:hypothetical protein